MKPPAFSESLLILPDKLGPPAQCPLKPAAHGRPQALAVRAQAVVALQAHDLAAGPVGRHPERVALALDDQHGYLDGLELGQAGLLGATRRVQREREADDAGGAGRGGGAAGHARARRAAAAEPP